MKDDERRLLRMLARMQVDRRRPKGSEFATDVAVSLGMNAKRATYILLK
jgi:hypothetical protein